MKLFKDKDEVLAFILTTCLVTMLVCAVVVFNLYSDMVNP